MFNAEFAAVSPQVKSLEKRSVADGIIYRQCLAVDRCWKGVNANPKLGKASKIRFERIFSCDLLIDTKSAEMRADKSKVEVGGVVEEV